MLKAHIQVQLAMIKNTIAHNVSNGDLNQILTTTTASLSLFGTTVIFCTYVLWPDLRTNTRKIIVFISVGDFLTAASNLLGLWDITSSSNTLCKAEAIINMLAVLPSFFWTVYLSVYLYLAICKKISRESERRVMYAFHATAWGIPLIVAISAASLGVVGNSGDLTSAGWCWIEITKSRHWKTTVLWMVIAGKGWEILAYFAITFFYVLVKLDIGRKVKQGHHSDSSFLTAGSLAAAKKADKKFTFIPVVFILLRIWGTIRFVRFVSCLPQCYPKGPSFQKWLLILQGVGDSSQGFANFVLFCLFTEKIRQRFKLCRVTGQFNIHSSFIQDSGSFLRAENENPSYGSTEK